jgi:cytochrome d ubiquinol oxidase subunit I
LTFFGSVLSAFWILMANSWMQTPAGFELVASGTKAQIVDFFACAFNPSMLARFLHTVDSLLILGSFCVMAIGAWYLLKHKHVDHGKQFIKTGLTVGIVTVALMLPLAHYQAVVVAEQQPAKLAAMEGHWEDGPVALSLFGWVDDISGETTGLSIPGAASFLGSGSFETVYPGLNTLKNSLTDFDGYNGVKASDYKGGIPPVNATFQAYHLMICLYAGLILWLFIAAATVRASKKGKVNKALLYLLIIGPIVPFLAIQSGWMVAEVGRQPWVVYNLLLTADAVSPVVSALEINITILLFIVFYTILFIAWLRVVLKMIRTGPILEDVTVVAATLDTDLLSDLTSAPTSDTPAATPPAPDPQGGE